VNPRGLLTLLVVIPLVAGCNPSPVKQVPATAEENPAAGLPVPSVEPARTPVPAAWSFPIAGGILPTAPRLLPNAIREYRNGVHQGVDLYHKTGDNAVVCGEPVLNAHEGWVVRADLKYYSLILRTYEMLLAELAQGPNEKVLDQLRGRQIWVRAADGTVVRYCHLSGIEPDIQVGLKIPAGIRIGAVGNTGTIDGAKGTGLNCHLHFEVWPTADSYLGKDQTPQKARESLARLFGQSR
jgi:murein DD-endopeptidase MepM/ murein hydrolase activator NlpD